MFLEVIALDKNDALAIEAAGANRIELVANMAEAGLSPSLQTVSEVCSAVKIPVRPMVRFHNRSFSYNDEEQKEMLSFIRSLSGFPIDGIVIGGVIDGEDKIDEALLEAAAEAAGGKGISFHRAFDTLYDLSANLKILEKYPVDTLLTSGGLLASLDKNVKLLNDLQESTSKIDILVGGGLNHSNIGLFKGSSIKNFHVGSCVRKNGDFKNPIDTGKIKSLFF